MKRETANAILTSLDYKAIEALKLFISDEIDIVHKGLETELDAPKLYQLQGKALMLRRLNNIRTDAENVHKMREE